MNKVTHEIMWAIIVGLAFIGVVTLIAMVREGAPLVMWLTMLALASFGVFVTWLFRRVFL